MRSMGLLSIFQRNKTATQQAKSGRGGASPARQAPPSSSSRSSNAAAPDTAEAVREARARARRRLMGATVLLLVGVIGFPLLFETQPRPIPVDLPIEIPSRGAASNDGAGSSSVQGRGHATPPANTSVAVPVTSSAAKAALAATTPSSAIEPESVSYDAHPATSSASVPTRAASVGGRPSTFATIAAALTPSAVHSSAVTQQSSAAATAATATAALPASARAQTGGATSKPASRADGKTDKPLVVAHADALPTSPPASSVNASANANASTAAALLAGAPAPKPSDAAPGATRFVVQVGAFADDNKLHDVRGKVEKIGLKTYTQAVETPAGKRVRVRVGPFATKAEADKAASRIKGGGLPAVVLVL